MTQLARASWLMSLCLWLGCSAGSGPPADAAPDTVSADADGDDGWFVIGVNPTGLEDPEQFTPLADGDELEIELGFQGLWMVVLAFQTQDTVEGLVTLYARVRTAEETIGEFGIAKQVLIHADDGYDYYLNLFLVVIGAEYAGEEAWVDLSAEDSDGAEVGGSVRVTLTSTDIPDTFTPPVLFPDAGVSSDTEDVGPDLDETSDSPTEADAEVAPE